MNELLYKGVVKQFKFWTHIKPPVFKHALMQFTQRSRPYRVVAHLPELILYLHNDINEGLSIHARGVLRK